MVIFKLVTSFLNLLANNFYMSKMVPLWNLENKLDLTSIGALSHLRLGVNNFDSIKFKFHQSHEITAMWSWKTILVDAKFPVWDVIDAV